MLLTVVSKDKLTLSMFIDFMRTLYDSDAEILDLNINTSSEMIDTLTRNFVGTHLKRVTSDQAWCLIKLKSRGLLTAEQLPLKIQESSTYIVQFDMFSTKPEVLKDRDGKFSAILERWEANIAKLNG